MASPAKRIEQLRKELEHHNYLYYVESKPSISDQEFDRLMRELADLEAAHPELDSPDSPTHRVGGEPIEGLARVEHAVPMQSIDNTYAEAEVRAFDERVRRGLIGQGGPGGNEPAYVLEPKIDGASINLRYENARLVLAATRGKGNVGDDVTSNARVIRSIPLTLRRGDGHAHGHKNPPPPAILEVRGEIYMDHADFQKVNAAIAAEGEEPYANARNLASGTIRRLDPNIVAKRRLRFLAHGLGQVEPAPATDSYWAWTHWLRQWGLPLPAQVWRVDSIDEAVRTIHEFQKLRPTLPYMTDGMVMKVDSFAQRQRLGATSKAPRWAIAFKYETEQQPTVLKDVRWQVGKGGNLTPVGDLEPVFISGVTVEHVTLHNLDQIRRLDLHYGDTVIVERAGEVIPYVVEAVKEKRPRGAKPVEAPRTCPECGTRVEREALPEEMAAYRCTNVDCDEFFVRHKLKRAKLPENCPVCGKEVEVLDAGIDLYCPNPACPAQVKERLRWFCGRGQMDIEGVGEKLVDQLIDRQMVQRFADLYRLKAADIAELGSEVVQDGKTIKRTVGEKVAQKVIDNIEASRRRPLDRLLAGLGIHHVGNRVSHVLATHFRSLDALAGASVEELAAVHEIGEVIAESVHDFFHNEAGRKVIAEFKAVGVDPKMPKPPSTAIAEKVPLAGQTVVVTGTLPTLKREEAEALIVQNGGRAGSSVSKKTSFVVAGESAGSKLDKANELGIEVVDEAEFLERLRSQKSV